jgi:hypothetical protein
MDACHRYLLADLLITLIVEAVVVQLCCTCYELYLLQQTESARLLGVLAMLGLPGPVLRPLANSDIKVGSCVSGACRTSCS